jgi:hypothetical protein
MKIIKSFLLVAVALTAPTWLHAQEMKTQVIDKTTEQKAPPVQQVSNIPSPEPQFKPMNGMAAKETPVSAAETPSPYTKDRDQKNGTVKPPPLQMIVPAVVTDVPAEKLIITLVPGPVVIKQQ